MADQTSPDSTGRNFGTHLPKVSGGQHLQPQHLNKISAEVEKATLQSGAGYTHTQTPTGTQLNIPRRHRRSFPWCCQSQGNWLTIDVGNFFMTGNSKVALLASNPTTAGITPAGPTATFLTATNNRNEWISNTSLPWAAGFGYGEDNKSMGLHMQGAEIWFDIEDMNYLTNTQMDNGYIPLSTGLDAGLYYLTIAQWSGRELSTADDPNASDWNTYSKANEGRTVPCIKYADLDCMFQVSGLVYPICTVDESGYIFQGISSDIFHNVADATPFTVTVNPDPDTENQYIVSIVVGTVCNVVPTYDDEETYLWDKSTMTVTDDDLADGVAYVVLKCTPKEEDEFSGGKFPETVTAQIVKTVNEYEDKDDAGFVVIALLRGREKQEGGNAGVEVLQVVTGSLWAERRKFSDNPATYYFFRMNTA